MGEAGHPQGTIHFKEESISLCHPERSTLNDEMDGAIPGEEESISLCHPERERRISRRTEILRSRSELALRNEGMTLLRRLRLTRNTSSLKCIGHKGPPLRDIAHSFPKNLPV